MKLILKLGAALVGALVVYLGVTFAQVWTASRRDEARPADAIVVFGAAQYDGRPSPVLRARLDHALTLYRRQLATRIVVTGGRREGDRVTEATASADYLHARGVPQRALLREVYGTTSWESLASAAHILKTRQLRQVVLVSDPFHSLRIKAMAGELGLAAHTSPTRTSPIGGISELRYMGRETLATAVGRLIGFRREAGVHDVVDRARRPGSR